MKNILFSDEQTVTKIVHDDNSETAIKTVSSCDTHMEDDGTFTLNETDRNKYSIFVSDSAGCYMKCKFCYLTLKNMKYQKLSAADITENIIEAVTARIDSVYNNNMPPIHNKFVKVCWMGMGDAFINTWRSLAVTESLLDIIMDKKYAVGLDGVDMSTVMPKVKDLDKAFGHLKELETRLAKYPLNPHSDILVHRDKEFSNLALTYPSRSRFRLFYSLHSAIQSSRESLIPNAMPLDKAIPALLEYSEDNKYNVIFHHMFMDGFNDTEEEVDALIAMIKQYGLDKYELRILRYNTCEVSTYIHESDNFKNIINRLMKVHPFMKVQISAGTEVKAACGQFLTNT